MKNNKKSEDEMELLHTETDYLGETHFEVEIDDLAEADELGHHTVTICGYRSPSGEYSIDSAVSNTGEEFSPDDFVSDAWVSQYEALLK